MKVYKKIIPTYYAKTIRDIPYEKLKEQGIKALFFDLDNTIISYDEHIINEDDQEFLENLNKEFKVLIISNSRKRRVSLATSNLRKIPYVKFAKKPTKLGFKKALKIVGVKREEACAIGDQTMTDILGANRTKLGASVLVYPKAKKTDHIFTRTNRRIERYFINKVKKHDYEKYLEVFSEYEK